VSISGMCLYPLAWHIDLLADGDAVMFADVRNPR
jgi:hypothetical protein